MYSTISVKGALDHLESLEKKGFKLCYVESIDADVWEWPDDPDEGPDVHPNPKYDKERGTHLAYFCSCPLDKVWGDDVDDAPYEHNAGAPYDYWTDDQGERKEGIIITIPFGWDNDYSLEWRLPRDYGNGNSHWSVVDINAGQVPWLWCGHYERKKFPECAVLSGGASIKEFLMFLSKVEKLKKKYGNKN